MNTKSRKLPESIQMLIDIANTSELFKAHSGPISEQIIESALAISVSEYLTEKRTKVQSAIKTLQNTEIDSLTESQIQKLRERLFSLIKDQEKLSDTAQYIAWLEWKLDIMQYETAWQARQKEIAQCMHAMSEDLLAVLTEDIGILTNVLINTTKTNTQNNG